MKGESARLCRLQSKFPLKRGERVPRKTKKAWKKRIKSVMIDSNPKPIRNRLRLKWDTETGWPLDYRSKPD